MLAVAVGAPAPPTPDSTAINTPTAVRLTHATLLAPVAGTACGYIPGVPDFGRELRGDFLLDPALTYLNHGTVGVTHRTVLATQRQIVDEIEHNPAKYLLRELSDADTVMNIEPRMRQAARPVAEFVAAEPGDVVFVDNITTGANAVLRNYPFQPGDEVLVTSFGYGGVTNAALYAAERACAHVVTATMPWPVQDPGDCVAAIAAALTPRTRLLIVDHLTAGTALVLPIAEIVAHCHRHDVQVLVDGAHVPGNIPLDVPGIGAEWYVANLHKWAFAPRSCGFLWASAEGQRDLHSLVISWGYGRGMTKEFDLPGTRDPSPMLAAPAGIEVMARYGLTDLYAYNHRLAWWAGQYVCDRWGTRLVTPESMIGAMITVPLPAALGSERDDALRTQAALHAQGIEVPVMATGGQLWTRISAQVYNDQADVETLADAVIALAGQAN